MRLDYGLSVLSEHVGQTSAITLSNGSTVGDAETLVTTWLLHSRLVLCPFISDRACPDHWVDLLPMVSVWPL